MAWGVAGAGMKNDTFLVMEWPSSLHAKICMPFVVIIMYSPWRRSVYCFAFSFILRSLARMPPDGLLVVIIDGLRELCAHGATEQSPAAGAIAGDPR